MIVESFLVRFLRCFKLRAIPAAMIILLLSIVLLPQVFGTDTGVTNPTSAENFDLGFSNWVNPTNVFSSNNVYATVTVPIRRVQDTNGLLVTHFDFAIPSGATINGVKVEVERKKSVSTCTINDNSIDLFYNNEAKGSVAGGSWSTTEAYSTFGGATNLWSWIGTLTPAIVNDDTFGFSMSSSISAGSTSCVASVDHIRMTVYYTVAASTGWINVTFVNQSPADLTFDNSIGPRGFNVTYFFNSSSTIINNTFKLSFLINHTQNNCSGYINGTTNLCGWRNTTMFTNETTGFNQTVKFRMYDNAILPASYLYNEQYIEANQHLQYSMNNQEMLLKMKFFNFTYENYTLFEVMANITTGGTQSLQAWFCNSSYANNKLVGNSNCGLFALLTATQPINHTHTEYSWHKVITMPVNMSTGSIAGVNISVPYSYIILRAPTINNWYIQYIQSISMGDSVQASNNGGVTYSDTGWVPDAHIHFFDNTDKLCFYAQANNTDGAFNQSDINCELLNISMIIPEPPIVDLYAPNGSPLMIPFRKAFENYLPLAYMTITMIIVFLLV